MSEISKESHAESFVERSKKFAWKYIKVLIAYSVLPFVVLSVLISLKLPGPIVASGLFLWTIGTLLVRNIS